MVGGGGSGGDENDDDNDDVDDYDNNDDDADDADDDNNNGKQKSSGGGIIFGTQSWTPTRPPGDGERNDDNWARLMHLMTMRLLASADSVFSSLFVDVKQLGWY